MNGNPFVQAIPLHPERGRRAALPTAAGVCSGFAAASGFAIPFSHSHHHHSAQSNTHTQTKASYWYKPAPLLIPQITSKLVASARTTNLASAPEKQTGLARRFQQTQQNHRTTVCERARSGGAAAASFARTHSFCEDVASLPAQNCTSTPSGERWRQGGVLWAVNRSTHTVDRCTRCARCLHFRSLNAPPPKTPGAACRVEKWGDLQWARGECRLLDEHTLAGGHLHIEGAYRACWRGS